MFRHKRPAIAPGEFGRRPLTEADLRDFTEQADRRGSGATPTLYDLIATLEALRKYEPVRARQVERDLRWMMRASDKYLNSGWEHPWTKRRRRGT